MKTYLKLFIFPAIIVLFLTSCSSRNIRQAELPVSNIIHIDTSQYAVLKFDTSETWLFSNARPSVLTEAEIVETETLLKKCIDKYNPEQQLQFNSESKAHPEYGLRLEDFVINLSRYKRQYVPVINAGGQKEVWINCFCEAYGSSQMKWRKDVLFVMDGGNCFFNLTINLTTKKYYKLGVNGVA